MKRLISLLALITLCGCATNKIEQKIGKRIETECGKGGDGIIRMTDITDFQWDKMFVFEYGAGRDQINEALGTPLPNYTEFTRRMVFLKDGKIVYREDEPTNIEGPVNGMVTFGIGQSNGYRMYTPDNAVFQAKREKHSGGIYYSLDQIRPLIRQSFRRNEKNIMAGSITRYT